MTTEQIIKALECCTSANSVSACMSGCPLYEKEDCECINDDTALDKYALALIKEQQAQIKVLEADRNNYKEWYVQAVGEIKELQAHNENLIKENKYLRERLKEEAELKEDMEDSIRAEIASGGTSCHWCEDKVKADTVKKMQERLHSTACDIPTKYCTRTDYSLSYRFGDWVDDIAKEILEGANDHRTIN